MLALLSSPLRRWLLATLLLPLIGYLLAKLGLYLQRRNGGAPTRTSRALLGISTYTRRRSSRATRDVPTDVVDTAPTPSRGVEPANPPTPTL